MNQWTAAQDHIIFIFFIFANHMIFIWISKTKFLEESWSCKTSKVSSPRHELLYGWHFATLCKFSPRLRFTSEVPGWHCSTAQLLLVSVRKETRKLCTKISMTSSPAATPRTTISFLRTLPRACARGSVPLPGGKGRKNHGQLQETSEGGRVLGCRSEGSPNETDKPHHTKTLTLKACNSALNP